MDPIALEAARKQAGLTYRQIEREMWGIMGAFTPTAETIRVWHTKQSKRAPDAAALLVLCNILRVDLDDVAPEYSEDLKRLRDVLS